MRFDLHFYGTAPMQDAGYGPPEPTDRRISNEDVITCYKRLQTWAKLADKFNFNTMWLTEHHFQYEGYEVTPNLILLGVHLAGITKTIKFGQMFNVVPQWHPLRIAEDFAMADILTNARLEFGVGRGTVPRESQTLGAMVASGDNEMSREADRINREIFEESMQIIRLAWENERFSFSGKHFTFPPPGIPDRGSTVTELTLVPRPMSPTIEIYQPVGSPATLEYVARNGFKGVFAMAPYEVIAPAWNKFAEVSESAGISLGRGEGRCLQIPIHVGKSTQEAFDTARGPHDEFVKFLSPYGRFSRIESGAPFNFRPSVEQSRSNGAMAIGSVEEVVDILGKWTETLGVDHFVLFPDFPGLSEEQINEQIELIAKEVIPALDTSN